MKAFANTLIAHGPDNRHAFVTSKKSNLFCRISILILCCIASASMQADDVGHFTIIKDGGIDQSDYSYAGNTLTILKDGDYTITMYGVTTTTRDVIVVETGLNVDITLEDVIINASTIGKPAFAIGDNSTVNLNLEGDNTLYGGISKAALEVPELAEINITSSTNGKLTAYGGNGGAGGGSGGAAGIGGSILPSGTGGSSGVIDISDCVIYAYGGNGTGSNNNGGGAAIGGAGGSHDSGGGSIKPITIDNCDIHVWGGKGTGNAGGGAGIGGGGGGGNGKDGGDYNAITISNSVPGSEATGGSAGTQTNAAGGGAGIGGGGTAGGNVGQNSIAPAPNPQVDYILASKTVGGKGSGQNGSDGQPIGDGGGLITGAGILSITGPISGGLIANQASSAVYDVTSVGIPNGTYPTDGTLKFDPTLPDGISGEIVISASGSTMTLTAVSPNDGVAGTATTTSVQIGSYDGRTFTLLINNAPSTLISDVKPFDITAPKAGEPPLPTIDPNGGTGYTAALDWNYTETYFDYNEAYTATITLSADLGYTFEGGFNSDLDISGFKINGNDPTLEANNGNNLVISYTFPATGPQPINISAIDGVTPPVGGALAVDEITETSQYTGTVSWTPSLPLDGRFEYNTVYTAEITLTAKANYTLNGVGVDYFTVAGATPGTVTNAANSGVITADFPATANQLISATDITGVTSPVAGATPSVGINDGTGFTATLVWDGSPGVFDYNTVYTATITLTADAGYTFGSGFTRTEDITLFRVNNIAPIWSSKVGDVLVFKVTFPITQPNITTVSPLPDGFMGTYYTTTLTADGSSPLTWSVTGLPAGLSCDATTGEISGTPTECGLFTSVVVTTTNTINVSATQTYQLTIMSAPVITTTFLQTGAIDVPYITQTLQAVGYDASGTPTAITWSIDSGILPNGLSLNTATGEISGTPTVIANFDFVVKATNGVGSTTAPLSINITETVYAIHVVTDNFSILVPDRTFAAPGETVTLTLLLWVGYELDNIYTAGLGGVSLVPTVQGGNIYKFTMPANDVTVEMTFKKTARQLLWETVAPLIENGVFEITQQSANEVESVRAVLLTLINDLIKDTGFVLSLDEVFIYFHRAAIGGDETNIGGVNGYFEFRVTPHDVLPTIYNNGIITASPVGNDVVDSPTFKVWVQNGVLRVTGLTPGQSWSVYNLSGVLVYRANASGNEASVPLSERGIYIVLSGNKTKKVIF